MSRFMFTVTKTVTWRGRTQEFSNRYCYEVGSPSDAELEAVIDRLTAIEKPVHATNVTFVEGRAWGPVNSNGSGGSMRVVKSLSGLGTGGGLTTTMYKECAWLIYWPLGRYGSRNRPQFIRKWLHTQTIFTASTAIQDGSTTVGSMPAALATYAGSVDTMVGAGLPSPCTFMTASGHTPASVAQVYPYLEHRQFGR